MRPRFRWRNQGNHRHGCNHCNHWDTTVSESIVSRSQVAECFRLFLSLHLLLEEQESNL